MRALVVAALVACGAAKPAAKLAATAPAAPVAAATTELTGPVKKIRVDGASAAVRVSIEAALRAATGKPLDTDQLRAALASAMATPGAGDVTVHGVQLVDGIELVVEVTMHPVLKQITAIETGGKPIALGMAAMPIGAPLDPKQVQAIAASLRDRYLGSGYFDPDVTWRRVAAGDGVEVVIEVKPGEVSVIASVAFTGNTVASKDLAQHVAKVLVVGEPALDEKIQRAGLMLEAYYWDRGYANVKVRAPRAAAGRIPLVFTIEEGPTFRISAIEVTGDVPATDRAKYVALFGVKKGDLFSRTAIVNGRKRVIDALVAAGKPSADVLPLTKVDLAKQTIGLTLEVTAPSTPP